MAPVCLFTFNRLEETKKTVTALKENYLAEDTDLYIFSDGWKNENQKEKVMAVREYLKTISGFKSVDITESPKNKGLANSIIGGVTQVVKKYGKVIVFEDDLMSSPNCLDFLNQALDFYENHEQVFSISGYSMDLSALQSYERDYYPGLRAFSWGWATWSRSWLDIDWEVKQYNELCISLKMQKAFKQGGSDLYRMLRNQMNGKIDSWAIRWAFNQFLRNQYTLFPKYSKIYNIGFNERGTHTKRTKRFETKLDETLQREFSFHKEIDFDKTLANQFKNKFSIANRFKDRF